MILKAVLTMPNVGSWDGKWHKTVDEYSKEVKILKGAIPDETYNKLKNGEEISGYYNFGDGWGANVTIKRKNKEKVSGNFSSYSWMIKTLLKDGFIHTDYKDKSYKDIFIR